MNNSPLYIRICKELEERKKNNLFREIPEFNQDIKINLSTNSYLSLETNSEVIYWANKFSQGILHGNLASRLIETKFSLFETLEKEIADWKNSPSALLFNSGYAANVGVIEALCTKDTHVFCDRLNHASIIDGIRLSSAILTRYKHCDIDDLNAKLKASEKKEKLIITDTVFSMDGDFAPLDKICELKRKYNCMLMVDEAHATGIFGKKLSGCVEKFGLENEVDIVIGTLSKAVAGLGGFFCGNKTLKEYFVNKARSLIYSTALPNSVLAWNYAAIKYIRQHPELGEKLQSKADFLRKEITAIGFNTLNSQTHIIPCIVESEEKSLSLSRFLFEQKIKVPCIRPPTVPKGTSRIRISVNLGITDEDIKYLLNCLYRWKKKNA